MSSGGGGGWVCEGGRTPDLYHIKKRYEKAKKKRRNQTKVRSMGRKCHQNQGEGKGKKKGKRGNVKQKKTTETRGTRGKRGKRKRSEKRGTRGNRGKRGKRRKSERRRKRGKREKREEHEKKKRLYLPPFSCLLDISLFFFSLFLFLGLDLAWSMLFLTKEDRQRKRNHVRSILCLPTWQHV